MKENLNSGSGCGKGGLLGGNIANMSRTREKGAIHTESPFLSAASTKGETENKTDPNNENSQGQRRACRNSFYYSSNHTILEYAALVEVRPRVNRIYIHSKVIRRHITCYIRTHSIIMSNNDTIFMRSAWPAASAAAAPDSSPIPWTSSRSKIKNSAATSTGASWGPPESYSERRAREDSSRAPPRRYCER